MCCFSLRAGPAWVGSSFFGGGSKVYMWMVISRFLFCNIFIKYVSPYILPPPFPPPRLLRYPFALPLPRPSVNTYQLTSSHFINLSSFPPLISLLHSLSSILSLHQQAELFTNAQIQNPKKKWQYQQPAQSPLSFLESSAWFT